MSPDPIERGTCPACGSGEVDRYVYGLPVPAVMEQAQHADWLHLQGCVVLGDDPRLSCRSCGHREPPIDPARQWGP
ncbi:hypothetical protein ACOKSZ_11915 [Propionibacteriaceae bacterium Y1685]